MAEYAAILRKPLGPVTLSSVWRALCGTTLPVGSRIKVFSQPAYRGNVTEQSGLERLISRERALKDTCVNKAGLQG